MPPVLGFSNVLFFCSPCDSLAVFVSCSGQWVSEGQRKPTLLCTCRPCFKVLHFIAFSDTAFLTDWRYMATLHQASLLLTFLSAASAHFMYLCHILVILAVFQTFSLLLYLLWWPVISDLWFYYNLLKAQISQFSRSVVCYSLPPHGLPCPSPTPRACSNPWPSRWWCHPTISSLSSPSPPAFSPAHQGLFQWVRSSHQVAKVLELQLQHQSFQWRAQIIVSIFSQSNFLNGGIYVVFVDVMLLYT